MWWNTCFELIAMVIDLNSHEWPLTTGCVRCHIGNFSKSIICIAMWKDGTFIIVTHHLASKLNVIVNWAHFSLSKWINTHKIEVHNFENHWQFMVHNNRSSEVKPILNMCHIFELCATHAHTHTCQRQEGSLPKKKKKRRNDFMCWCLPWLPSTPHSTLNILNTLDYRCWSLLFRIPSPQRLSNY